MFGAQLRHRSRPLRQRACRSGGGDPDRHLGRRGPEQAEHRAFLGILDPAGFAGSLLHSCKRGFEAVQAL